MQVVRSSISPLCEQLAMRDLDLFFSKWISFKTNVSFWYWCVFISLISKPIKFARFWKFGATLVLISGLLGSFLFITRPNGVFRNCKRIPQEGLARCFSLILSFCLIVLTVLKCLNTCLWNPGMYRHRIARQCSEQFGLGMFYGNFNLHIVRSFSMHLKKANAKNGFLRVRLSINA